LESEGDDQVGLAETIQRWWGDYSLAAGTSGVWKIGAFSVRLERTEKEWRIYLKRGSVHGESGADVSVEIPAEVGEQFQGLKRYCFRETTGLVRLMPALADRPVVTRPFLPFYVPSRQEATIFASSPLWITIHVNDPPQQMDEFPIFRPSDTWLGASTMDGELCYASRTNCFLSPEEVPGRPHRAITPVKIWNRALGPLLLERVSLPVKHLSLFAGSDGNLWTEHVTLERTEGGVSADLRITEGPPPYAGEASLVSEPRERLEKNIMVRALGAIFG